MTQSEREALFDLLTLSIYADHHISLTEEALAQAFSPRTRVVLFNGNYGQHMAIMAAFERVRGEVIVTLDADLQNPPEEIATLLAAMDRGHDYVGSIRLQRNDTAFRRVASRLMNRLPRDRGRAGDGRRAGLTWRRLRWRRRFAENQGCPG